MLSIASGIARGRVGTTPMATESHKMAVILQLIGYHFSGAVPGGASYPYKKAMETNILIFSCLAWLEVLLVGA